MAERGSSQRFPLLLLLLAVHFVDAQINVIPSYPESGNYNLVRLTCKNDFNDPVDAGFVANGSLVTPDSTLVSVQETESSYIQFVFTQSQESFFLCRATNGGQESEPIALAAQPLMTTFEDTNRYVVIPNPNNTRRIQLKCAIRPGALAQQYSVQWQKSTSPMSNINLSPQIFDITEEISFSDQVRYRCRVDIFHTGTTNKEIYSGPWITIHTIALGCIKNEIHNMTVTAGEKANFPCEYSMHNNSDIIVYWTIGGQRFDCGTSEQGVAPGNNGCYEDGKQSILVIERVAMFEDDVIQVFCNLEQNILEVYGGDNTFEDHFNDTVQKGAFLKIEDPRLLVEYPDSNNQSLVRLLCDNEGATPLEGAVFFKDGVILTDGSGERQVSVVTSGNGEIEFVFTQEQEGVFYCVSEGRSSIAIGLAASPAIDYDGKTKDRYIVFPNSETRRTIKLSCDIRPGALASRYSVQWFEYSSENNSFFPLSDSGFDMDISTSYVGSSEAPRYQCRVTIEHRNDALDSEIEYVGPVIAVNGKVLVVIVGEIGNVTVKQGKSTEFKCEIANEKNDFSVYWTVGEERYNCTSTSESQVARNGCYMTGSVSFLLLRDTLSYGAKVHTVQCAVEQNLPTWFVDDPSFEPDSYSRVTKSGTLTIQPLPHSVGGSDDLSDREIGGIAAGMGGTLVLLVLGAIVLVAVIRLPRGHSGKNDGNCNNGDPMELSGTIRPERSPTVEDVGTLGSRQQSNEHEQEPIEDRDADKIQSYPQSRQHSSEGVSRDQKIKELLFDDLAAYLIGLAPQWYALGIQLGLETDLLNTIGGGRDDTRNCFCKVLEEWLKGSHGPCTKQTLLQAIRSPTIRNNRLARQIEYNMEIPDRFTPVSLGLLQVVPSPWQSGKSQTSIMTLNQKEQEGAVSIFTGECRLPVCMTEISILTDCTFKGGKFTDEANDFSLDIPEGAIPEGERLTVDLGVALFGPFQFPEGLRPVSPVFWVCVRDNNKFNFSKPVTVTLPHFLDLENDDDIQSLGLTFLKADHKKNSEGLYEFQPADGDINYSNKTGNLHTTHFCSYCIACKDAAEVLTKTEFCIISVLPTCATLDGKRQCGFFFISLNNLSTCLKRVDEIIAEKKLEHRKKSEVKFKFNKSWPTMKPALEISVTHPKYGNIGIEGKLKIFRSEVDFFIRKRTAKDNLEAQERRNLYPPRFQVFFASSPKDPTLGGGKIKFKGADGDLQYDIYLDPPTRIPTVPTNYYAQNYLFDVHAQRQSLLAIEDLHEVRSQLMEVAVRWRDIGLELGLSDPWLETIQADNKDVTSCLTAMLRDWLNRTYDTTVHGEPSWLRLSEAVRHRAGGNNPALADEIIHRKT